MLATLLSGALLVVAVAGQTCPPPFVEAGDFCLYMGTTNMSWEEAKDFCTTLGEQGGAVAHLATFPTCEEFSLATYWLNINSPPDSDFWVGGVKASYPNNWLWLTLEPLQTGVPMWAYTEGHDDGKDCASMNKLFRHKLDCCGCEELKQPLCQVKQTPTVVADVTKPKEILNCPHEAIQVGDHCYEFHHKEEDFNKAYEECSRENRQFFYPETCAEFTHMAHHLETMNEEWDFWVGAEDTSGFHEWTWTDGENIPGGAPYWSYDQPTHATEDNPRKYCGYMGHANRYYLSDANRNQKKHFICKVTGDDHPGPP